MARKTRKEYRTLPPWRVSLQVVLSDNANLQRFSSQLSRLSLPRDVIGRRIANMMGLEGVKERRLLEDRGVVILSKCLEDLFLNPKARFPHPFFQRSSGGPAFRFQSQLVIGIPGRNSNRLCRLIGKLDSARIDTD